MRSAIPSAHRWSRRTVRPWQEVLIDLAGRLGLPAFTDAAGRPKYDGYQDFIVRHEQQPGQGFLAGWRGADGDRHLRGEPNPDQWQRYIDNRCYFRYELPESARFYKFANRDYLDLAVDAGFIKTPEPVVMQLYSEPLQRFRLAGQGLYDGPQPDDPVDRERLVRYFDPLPIWYQPLEQQRVDAERYPFFAVTQRPMMQYHSWDSQNAWLRQILSHNHLYLNRSRAESLGIADGDRVSLRSHNGPRRGGSRGRSRMSPGPGTRSANARATGV